MAVVKSAESRAQKRKAEAEKRVNELIEWVREGIAQGDWMGVYVWGRMLGRSGKVLLRERE